MYNKDNDIESILREDIKDKKRAGSGVFSRASRRGYTGAVRTQVDYLKGKAKKEYMGNGECIVVGNIYDEIKNIPSLDDLRAMDKEVAKGIINYARAKHGLKALSKHWGISSNYFYRNLFPEFSIDTSLYHARGERAVKPITKALEHSLVATKEYLESSDLFELKYIKNESNGKTIKERIMDYLTVLEEEGIYEVNFTVKERR